MTGPLDVQIEEACHFVERNMRVAAIKNPARIDIPQYAMNAVLEAVLKKSIKVRGQVRDQVGGQVVENIRARGQVMGQVRGQVEKLLYAIKDGELTVSELMRLVGVTSRAHFREDVIVPALADGYIEMTQPNSPRSPTQKYRITEKGRLVVSR